MGLAEKGEGRDCQTGGHWLPFVGGRARERKREGGPGKLGGVEVVLILLAQLGAPSAAAAETRSFPVSASLSFPAT